MRLRLPYFLNLVVPRRLLGGGGVIMTIFSILNDIEYSIKVRLVFTVVNIANSNQTRLYSQPPSFLVFTSDRLCIRFY